ncbi:hypothetical protein SAMN04490243_2353 [Robiginitalea myxolifaciens]|uniref:Uncharacterized protein n=1 Tax=Robiginitalea myxolifaciens TaxID=400055 RepID=A0A1I6H7A3_9FLAO|nr:hypothetical protein [Robiginitalea myxolifaciens]SFR50217.1 hypothetical protein SAMN04490243_2353 [Robiginitalea myxolifaciens]
MEQGIYYILAGLLFVYLVIGIYNRRKGKQRRNRNFMEGRRYRDRKETGNHQKSDDSKE